MRQRQPLPVWADGLTPATLPEHRPAPGVHSGARAALIWQNLRGLSTKVVTGLTTQRLERQVLSGPERWSGEPLRVLYTGHGENLAFLRRTLFRKIESEQTLPSAWIGSPWALPAVDVDLQCTERPLPWFLLPPPAGHEALLCWIKQSIPIPEGREALFQQVRRKTRMEAERQIRRRQLHLRLQEARDIATPFYHELYRPYVATRFGEAGVAVSEPVFQSYCETHQALTVSEGHTLLGALLMQAQGAVMIDGWTGVRCNAEGAPEAGISEALDYGSLIVAFQAGCQWLDMGTSRALLSDGVLRYKQRWGARIHCGVVPKGEWTLRVLRPTAAVMAQLEQSGFLARRQGQLQVVRGLSPQGLVLEPLQQDAEQASFGG